MGVSYSLRPVPLLTTFGLLVTAAVAGGSCGGSFVSDERRCTYGGTTYAPGDSFPAADGCNSCSCTEEGQVVCTAMACVGCSYGGVAHQPGDTFPSLNGCEVCTCELDGGVSCALEGCSVGCEFGGPLYGVGDTVPSGDGCNSCTCAAGGTFGCTEMACGCDPSAEFGREYVALSPAECAVIDYTCPPHTTAFANDCGCGCEQAPWCPAYFGCMPGSEPGCDTAGLGEICPYSGFAL